MELSLNDEMDDETAGRFFKSFDAPCLELSLNYCIAGLLQTTKFPGFDAPCLELSLNFVKKIFIFFIKAQEFRCSLFGAFFKL